MPRAGWPLSKMAEASGLRLLAVHERDPLRTTSFGTGQLLRTALDAGARTRAGSRGRFGDRRRRRGLPSGSRLDDAGPRPPADSRSDQRRGTRPHRRYRTAISSARSRIHRPRRRGQSPVRATGGSGCLRTTEGAASPEQVTQLAASLHSWRAVLAQTPQRWRSVARRPLRRRCRWSADRLENGAARALRLPASTSSPSTANSPGDCAHATCASPARGASTHRRSAARSVAGVARLAREAGKPTVAFAGSAQPAHCQTVADLASGAIAARHRGDYAPPPRRCRRPSPNAAANLRRAAAAYVSR